MSIIFNSDVFIEGDLYINGQIVIFVEELIITEDGELFQIFDVYR